MDNYMKMQKFNIYFYCIVSLLSSLSVCYAQSDSLSNDTAKPYEDFMSIGVNGGYLYGFDIEYYVPAMFMLDLKFADNLCAGLEIGGRTIFLGVGMYGKKSIGKNIFLGASAMAGTVGRVQRTYSPGYSGNGYYVSPSYSDFGVWDFSLMGNVSGEYRIFKHLGINAEIAYRHTFSDKPLKNLCIMGGLKIYITESNKK